MPVSNVFLKTHVTLITHLCPGRKLPIDMLSAIGFDRSNGGVAVQSNCRGAERFLKTTMLINEGIVTPLDLGESEV